jgi:hypothetical protein
MASLLSGIFLFGVGFLVHLCVWKIRIPEKQIRVLLSIFFLLFIACVLLCIYFSESNRLINFTAPKNLAEYISFATLFFSLLGTYLFLYAGLIDVGPSVTFILSIADAGEKGIDKKTLQSLITAEGFFGSRIESLIEGKYICKVGDKYIVSQKGIKLLVRVNKLREWMNISLKIG